MKTKFSLKLSSTLIKVLSVVFVLCLMTVASFAFLGKTEQASAATAIKPFALYTFEDSTNLGKDTSGNGLHLTSQGTVTSALDGSDRYLSLKGAGGLYAPGLSGIKDFSDYMTGSYTVRMIIKSSTKGGAQYLLTTGQYNDAFTIVNNANIEVQVGNLDLGTAGGTNKLSFEQATTSWVDLVIVGDAANNKATVYANGVQKATVNTSILFSRDPMTGAAGSSYSFNIGKQGNTVGSANAQYATCDYKKVEIYNCALTAQNVTEMYASGTMSGTPTASKYISSIGTIDTSKYNFNLTDKNTFENITKTLPNTIPVVLSDNSLAEARVEWFGETSTTSVKAILMDPSLINANQIYYLVACKQGVFLNYDKNLVTVSDVKIDGTAYTPGTEVTKTSYTLTFKLTSSSDHVVINSVKYHDVTWPVLADGSVTISVTTGGAQVDIDAYAKQYKVTYYDDEFVLGVSRYTYKGSEELLEWAKTGYTFAGWYTSESLQDQYKLTALPYNAPQDLKLYAKFVSNAVATTRYRVSIDEAFNTSAGTITGFENGQAYDANSSLSITITAKTGYEIASIFWNDQSVSVTNKSTMTFSKTVTGNSTVMATFTTKNVVSGPMLTLEVGNGGTVTGVTNGGVYTRGTMLNATITPQAGYVIQSITWGGEPQTITNANGMVFKPIITSDKLLQVTFAEKMVNVTLTYDHAKGSVSGIVAGLNKVDSYNVTISPNQGYLINKVWVNGIAVTVTSENGFSFERSVDADTSIEVTFKSINAGSQATVTLVNDSSKGLVSGIRNNGVYELNETVTITISAHGGYVVSKVQWNDTVIEVSPNTETFEMQFKVEEDTILTITYADSEIADSGSSTHGCGGSVSTPIYASVIVLIAGLALVIKKLAKKQK